MFFSLDFFILQNRKTKTLGHLHERQISHVGHPSSHRALVLWYHFIKQHQHEILLQTQLCLHTQQQLSNISIMDPPACAACAMCTPTEPNCPQKARWMSGSLAPLTLAQPSISPLAVGVLPLGRVGDVLNSVPVFHNFSIVESVKIETCIHGRR